MDKFMIYTSNSVFEIIAEDVSWDHNGLKLHKDGEIIAMFLQWNCWINTSKEGFNDLEDDANKVEYDEN